MSDIEIREYLKIPKYKGKSAGTDDVQSRVLK